MENISNVEVLSEKQNIKLILLSPVIGGILTSLYFILYLIYTLVVANIYEKSGFSGFVMELFKLSSIMVLISFVLSYILGFFLLIPLHFFQKKYKWSDGVFWFINTLVTTVIGIFVAYGYSSVNAIIVFVIFISFFSCGLFNASLLSALKNMMIKEKKRVSDIDKVL